VGDAIHAGNSEDVIIKCNFSKIWRHAMSAVVTRK